MKPGSQARAREDTIRQYPYMDTHLDSKQKHHQHVRTHYNGYDQACKRQIEHTLYGA